MATATRRRKIKGPAANVQRKAGAAPKWDDEMQQRIVDDIKAADKAGLPRTRVFERLASEFNEEYAETYTQHQVASQFHLVKTRFGYVVDKQAQGEKAVRVRTITAPPTRSGFRDVNKANAKIDELTDANVRLRNNLAEVRAARNESVMELQGIKKQLRQAGIVLRPKTA